MHGTVTSLKTLSSTVHRCRAAPAYASNNTNATGRLNLKGSTPITYSYEGGKLILNRVIRPVRVQEQGTCCGFTQISVARTGNDAQDQLSLLSITMCGRMKMTSSQRCKRHENTANIEIWEIQLLTEVQDSSNASARAALIGSVPDAEKLRKLLRCSVPLSFRDHWGEVGVSYEDYFAAPERKIEDRPLQQKTNLPIWRR